MSIDPSDEKLQLSLIDSLGRARTRLMDAAEMAAGAALNSETMSQIPVVSYVLAVSKDALSIRDYLFSQKLGTFIIQMNAGVAGPDAVSAFQRSCREDAEYRNRVLLQLMGSIDRIQSDLKSAVLACLFAAYLEGALTWRRFMELGSVLEGVNTAVFDYLVELGQAGFRSKGEDREWEPMLAACGIGQRYSTTFSVNSFGQDLYRYGLKPLYEQ